MVDPELLQILVCPESKQSLKEADADLVRRLNVALAAGSIRNRAREVAREPLDGALVREVKCTRTGGPTSLAGRTR